MDVLRYLLVSLHDRLPLGDGLINSLYSNGLLKRNDVEELKRRRRDEAIDCLVTEILPFVDPAAFPVFCKALQAKNAEHALRPIRAVVETIVPHFQGRARVGVVPVFTFDYNRNSVRDGFVAFRHNHCRHKFTRIVLPPVSCDERPSLCFHCC